MICPYCKKTIPDTAVFCSGCGQSVAPDSKDSQNTDEFWNEIRQENDRADQIKEELEKEKQTKRNKTKIMIMSIISIIIVGMVVYFLMIRPNIEYSSALKYNDFAEKKSGTDIDLATNAEKEEKSESTTKQVDFYENENSPFKQKYWIIFTEGNRDNRVEASTIDSSISSENLYFVWDSSIELNDTSSSKRCNQFCLKGSSNWEQIGDYSRLTDWATNIIASNLDVYDSSGNLICKKILYQDIDWDKVSSYQ